MNIKYVDAHCHLQFEQYDQDREEIIEQMREKGVAGIVVGCDYESSQKAVALADKYEHLYASVGLHPNHEANEQYDISYYRALAQNEKVVAVGECGLDYYRLPSDATAYSAEATKAKQKELFKKQITLAFECDKPLMLHVRPTKGTTDAYHDVIEILKEAKGAHPELCGDVHFFVGGVTEAESLIKLGFTISFTAVITFAHDYDEVIRAVPLESILVETDAPYVAPASRRGERNDPLAVEEVVAKIAEIKGEDLEAVRRTLLKNVQKLFNLETVK